MNFEILEHTADIGFKAWGNTFEQMLAGASCALVSIALEIDEIEPRQPYPLAARGEDLESLVVNWLSEVLYYVDGHWIGLRRFDIERTGAYEARGRGWGEPRRPEQHAKLVVKGVTYHQLRVVEEDGRWWCQVYLDI